MSRFFWSLQLKGSEKNLFEPHWSLRTRATERDRDQRADVRRQDDKEGLEIGSQRVAMETKRINSAKDLRVYKKAYALAMEIFHISKRWPSEEKYSLTDQIRRSSRSVCSNLRETWLPARRTVHVLCLCNWERCDRPCIHRADRGCRETYFAS